MKRQLTSLVLSAAFALVPVTAMASDTTPAPQTQQTSDLAPGPAAGVQHAQMFGDNAATYALVGLVAVGVIVAAASGGGGGSTPSTTGTLP